MKIFNYIPIILLSALLGTSCVSKKKYMTSQHKLEDIYAQNQKLEEDLTDEREAREKFQQRNIALEEENAFLVNELAFYDTQKAEKERKVNALQQILENKFQDLREIQKLLSDALVDHPVDDLKVFLDDGQVHLRLNNQLLFPTASTKVKSEGKDALKTVAKILKENPELTIMVEGHTDSIPVAEAASFDNNWDLSVLRASHVVKTLQDYGISPERITPAGRSKYEPIADNDNRGGRTLNRRTEIIFQPDLAPLYEYFATDAYDYLGLNMTTK